MIKLIIFFITIFLLHSVKAEDSLLTLKQQLDRLQREVNDLSKTVFAGTRDVSDNQKNVLSNTDSSQLTAFDLRIYDLEKDIKDLNSNFEELVFQLDDLKKLFIELSAEIETSIVKINEEQDANTDQNLNNDQGVIEGVEENSLGTLVINSEDLSGTEDIQENIESSKEILDQLSPEQKFQNAFDMLRNQQFENAKEALKNFLQNHENHKLSGSAHYWLGEIYILKKEYREAALILAEGYQKFPDSVKAPEILYKLSESLIAINKTEDGCNTLQKLIKEFPNNNLTSLAKSKISSLDCIITTE